MKKVWLALYILIIAVVLMACGGVESASSHSVSVDSASETESAESSTEEAECYSITYVGIKEYDKSVIEIPAKMKSSTKSYPSTYQAGTVTEIDPLQYAVVSFVEYEFLGYYIDETCTQAFTRIDENATGEYTVYALIRVHGGTPNV